jgi:hypothetical protein
MDGSRRVLPLNRRSRKQENLNSIEESIMMRISELFAGTLLILALLVAFPASSIEEDIRRIAKEKVKELIGKPGVTVIDVRYDDSWKQSDMKIAGAVREHPNEIGSWAGKYDKDSTIILYCD